MAALRIRARRVSTRALVCKRAARNLLRTRRLTTRALACKRRATGNLVTAIMPASVP